MVTKFWPIFAILARMLCGNHLNHWVNEQRQKCQVWWWLDLSNQRSIKINCSIFRGRLHLSWIRFTKASTLQQSWWKLDKPTKAGNLIEKLLQQYHCIATVIDMACANKKITKTLISTAFKLFSLNSVIYM